MNHPFPNQALFLIPALPLAGFIINALISMVVARRKLNPPVGFSALIGCLMPFISFVIAVWGFLDLASKPEEHRIISSGALFSWLPTALFKIDFALTFDTLASVMTLVVTGVGTLIHIYSIGYMKEDKGFSKYFCYLNFFLFFMLLLVLGDNLLVLFVGWEGVGLCSYLLIGFWFDDPVKAQAGKKAFVVNRIGDFGFLIGIFLIINALSGVATGSPVLSYSFLQANQHLLAPVATVITLCLFVGATGKSAQIPLYVWLPDAMAGPTPVSALIHAATMVTAGIYMVARLNFLFVLAPATLHLIACIGLATAFMAALIGLTQYDIKKVLAYSTVSQLGYMFLALGVNAPAAAIFHVVTHAFFKACLFLGSGSVIHAVHDQDIRNMGGLFKKMPITGITFLLSTIAIAGIPPFSGFFSKDEILWHVYQGAPLPFYLIALATAGITAFYMFRVFTYTFLGKCRNHHPDHIHESPPLMTFPLIVLGILAVIGGFMGIPEVLGGTPYLSHWLDFPHLMEGEAGDHGMELKLMGLSALWALGFSLLSLMLYKKNVEWTKGLKSKLKGFHQLISNKFYIDEIYNCFIVKPIKKISEWVLWKGTDQAVIDGVGVHGWTSIANFTSRVISLIQSGLVSQYLIYLWICVVAVLFYVVR